MQFEFFRELVIKVKPTSRFDLLYSRDIEHLQKIFQQAYEAEFRAIHTDVFLV